MEVPAAQSPARCQEQAALGEAGSDICFPNGMSFSLPKGVESWGMLGESVLAETDIGLGAFVSGTGCLAFLMSKYVLFKETNKAKHQFIWILFICFKY